MFSPWGTFHHETTAALGTQNQNHVGDPSSVDADLNKQNVDLTKQV